MRAALLFGPNTGIFFSRSLSARPVARAFSGPITTRSKWLRIAKSVSRRGYSKDSTIFSAIAEVPPLPGVANNFGRCFD